MNDKTLKKIYDEIINPIKVKISEEHYDVYKNLSDELDKYYKDVYYIIDIYEKYFSFYYILKSNELKDQEFYYDLISQLKQLKENKVESSNSKVRQIIEEFRDFILTLDYDAELYEQKLCVEKSIYSLQKYLTKLDDRSYLDVRAFTQLIEEPLLEKLLSIDEIDMNKIVSSLVNIVSTYNIAQYEKNKLNISNNINNKNSDEENLNKLRNILASYKFDIKKLDVNLVFKLINLDFEYIEFALKFFNDLNMEINELNLSIISSTNKEIILKAYNICNDWGIDFKEVLLNNSNALDIKEENNHKTVNI